jgi:hypothetical protein
MVKYSIYTAELGVQFSLSPFKVIKKFIIIN